MKQILILLIKLYRVTISPFYPLRCRFEPSCSQYMIEAIKKYGCLKGLWLGLKRICRCRPGGGSGYDPVK